MGFLLGFEATNSPREGSELTDRINRGVFRIAYTGRDDFVIAIASSFSRLSFVSGSETRNDISTGSFLFDMRYYF